MLYQYLDEEPSVTYNDHRRAQNDNPRMATGLRYDVAPTGAFDELVDGERVHTVKLLADQADYMQQLLRRKRALIGRIVETDRIAEDVPTGDMTYAEIKAAATADPHLLAQVHADRHARCDAALAKAQAAHLARLEDNFAGTRADLAIRVAMVPYYRALLAQDGRRVPVDPALEQRDGREIGAQA